MRTPLAAKVLENSQQSFEALFSIIVRKKSSGRIAHELQHQHIKPAC